MITHCPDCSTQIRVMGNEERIKDLLDKALWPQGYPCVMFFCSGTAKESVVHPNLKATDITTEQYFRALHGGGLPEEVSPSFELVQRLCTTEMVTCIELERAEQPILAAIHLQTSVLHFAASPKGAVVFKITKRQETDDGRKAA